MVQTTFNGPADVDATHFQGGATYFYSGWRALVQITFKWVQSAF
jgi:hypothetical protein